VYLSFLALVFGNKETNNTKFMRSYLLTQKRLNHKFCGLHKHRAASADLVQHDQNKHTSPDSTKSLDDVSCIVTSQQLFLSLMTALHLFPEIQRGSTW
jgi:hypothetical protein